MIVRIARNSIICAVIIISCMLPAPVWASAWSNRILFTFHGADGARPYPPIVLNGALYGTAAGGGRSVLPCDIDSGNNGGGVVYRLSPSNSPAGAWYATVLHSFTCGTDGVVPAGPLVADQDGNLFGLTTAGGEYGRAGFAGTAFELIAPQRGTTAWTERVIHSFGGPGDGAGPFGALIADAAGALYGITQSSGSTGNGTIFKLTRPRSGTAGWTESVLYNFKGGNDGAQPNGTLIWGPAGTLYGTTYAGGGGFCGSVGFPVGCGTAFALTPPSAGRSAWTERVLYDFPFSTQPGGIAFGPNGVLYGTSTYLVYQLAPPTGGGTVWTNTQIANIAGINNPLAVDSLNRIYGSTDNGDVFQTAVFRLTPAGPGQWTRTYLHVFDPADGVSGFTLAGPHAIFGATPNGGTPQSGFNGSVFELTETATPPPWHETTIATQPAGGLPNAPLVQDARGILYGTNDTGGAFAKGAMYALAPPAMGKAPWPAQLLYSFRAGQTPNGGLNLGLGGVLYGTTYTAGGCRPGSVCGTVYQLAPPSLRVIPLGPPGWSGLPAWTQTILYGFTGGADGGQPASSLIADPSGALYGTTSLGGFRGSPACAAGGCGTVFKLTPPPARNGSWTLTVLHAFTGLDGSAPHGALIAGAGGVLYGTTTAGGTGAAGTIFALKPPGAVGNAPWTISVLHAFTSNDGTPNDPLVIDARGALYGTLPYPQAGPIPPCPPTGCGGTVFKLSPVAGNAGWNYQTLYDFSLLPDGSSRVPGSLKIDADGALYGTTQYGSPDFTFCCGTAFKLIPPPAGQTPWIEQDLYDFSGGADGASPVSGMVLGRFGIFGFSQSNVCFSCANVFRLVPPR